MQLQELLRAFFPVSFGLYFRGVGLEWQTQSPIAGLLDGLAEAVG